MKKFLLLLFATTVITTGCVTAKNSADSNNNSTPQRPAPDFTLQDYSGKTVSLADFKGKPLVLNSWASWCPFCVNELPDFVAVQKDLGDAVSVVAINRRESLKTAKGFTDELGVTNDLIFLMDSKDSFYQSIGGFSMPETLFINSDGNIVQHYRGKLTESQFRQKIQLIL